MLDFVLLIIGFLLLMWGANHFVSGASSLAGKLGVPSLIIGLTIVAFGTSAPELSVSVIAGIKGSNEIALGNVLGSNIFNLLCVLGASTLIKPILVDKELLKRDWLASIIVTIVLFVLMLIGKNISRFDAIILLLAFLAVTYMQIISAKKSKAKATEERPVTIKNSWIIAFKIVIGLASVIFGGQLTIHGATEIALSFGLSETIIGLTIVAIGTSLPELVTSVIASKKGENAIAVGNVIGSNIFNVMFILGLSSLFNPIKIQPTAIYDTLILFIITIALFLIARKTKLNRLCGATCILLYVAYTVWLILR